MKYYQSRWRHDALTKLAAKYGIDYIDANFDEIAIGIQITESKTKSKAKSKMKSKAKSKNKI